MSGRGDNYDGDHRGTDHRLRHSTRRRLGWWEWTCQCGSRGEGSTHAVVMRERGQHFLAVAAPWS